jgi:glycerol-3-phosphate dehydrogenase
MVRRTQLFFRDRDQGLGAVEVVADRMGTLLGWEPSRKQGAAEAYRQVVARARAWRSELSAEAMTTPA